MRHFLFLEIDFFYKKYWEWYAREKTRVKAHIPPHPPIKRAAAAAAA
jgi:hypothetical protein